jgi:TatA/E family protein of Tat protein translocase
MLGNLSGGELVLLAVVALLAFGAHRLPEAGRSLGRGLRELERAVETARDALRDEVPGRAAARPRPPRPPRLPRLSD